MLLNVPLHRYLPGPHPAGRSLEESLEHVTSPGAKISPWFSPVRPLNAEALLDRPPPPPAPPPIVTVGTQPKITRNRKEAWEARQKDKTFGGREQFIRVKRNWTMKQEQDAILKGAFREQNEEEEGRGR